MPSWPGVAGTLLSVLGLGVAGYLTYEHFTSSTTLACSDNGVVNCLKVTTSSYSAVAGVPVAVLGLIFFAVMLVLQLPPMWRRPEQAIRLGRLAWAVVGLGTVLYLLYAELYEIDAICLWCTAVHVLTLLLFGTTVFATTPLSRFGVGRRVRPGGWCRKTRGWSEREMVDRRRILPRSEHVVLGPGHCFHRPICRGQSTKSVFGGRRTGGISRGCRPISP